MSTSASASLSTTLAHAISFLVRPLSASYPATTIVKLQLVLEANLTAFYAPSWTIQDPLHGSGRRCLTFSPSCLPPRAVYSACIAAGVQWFDWIALLGGKEFDFFVDPGCISVRIGGAATNNQLTTVWADEVPSPAPKVSFDMGYTGKTIAQKLLEEDTEEDEQLFALIADEVSAPTWVTPTMENFPIPTRSSSPPSRCSSRSSGSDSGLSFSSVDTAPTHPNKDPSRPSRRERARQARVFVDSSKTDVTPYDGGKTTVLTGGVMLGGAPSGKAKKAARPTNTTSGNWRS